MTIIKHVIYTNIHVFPRSLCGKMSVEITKTMNKPDLLPEEDNFDRFINGFLNQPARAEQPSYNPLVFIHHWLSDAANLYKFFQNQILN